MTAALHDRARRAGKTAIEKGWQVPNWEVNFPGKIALVWSEYDEALDAVTAGHLAEELADVVIRTINMLQSIWPDAWNVTPVTWPHAGRPPESPVRFTVKALRHISFNIRGALEAWRKDQAPLAKSYLETVVKAAFTVAVTYKLDLLAAIDAKLTANEGRPRLHGKKRDLG